MIVRFIRYFLLCKVNDFRNLIYAGNNTLLFTKYNEKQYNWYIKVMI